MVQRGKTIRWWNIREHVKKLTKDRKAWIHSWKYINPFWFRHELKTIRVKLHRKSRHANRIRLKKGLDIEPELRTNGWETH